MIDLHDFYSALVHSSDDAIVAKDVDGIVLGWNAAAERLFGWTAAEMIGGSIRRLLPADRQDEEDLILARIRAGERVGQFFTKRVHKSGALFDVSLTVSPVRDPAGAIVGAAKIARNAGPYFADQQRLRESERRFRMMADNISQLAWIARGDGHLFWYNRRWLDYTGATLAEMAGWGWEKVQHPDHLARVIERWRVALERGEEWEDTFPLRRHDGEWRWFLSRAKPICGDDGRIEYWFGTNTDITESREQAEQIRLLLMEVNHRAKNLLGTVQALARRTAPDEAGFLKRFEDRIRSLAVNQDILVKREWRQVPVRELAEAQLAFIEQAPGDFTLVGPDVALVPRAAETIGMALHELATNALKYGALSVAGGYVDIGWSVDEPAPASDPAAERKSAGDPDGQTPAPPPAAGPGFSLWWRESGGPPVRNKGHVGFGTRLMRDVPRHNLGAEVDIVFHEGGVCWEMKCALAAVTRPMGAGV